MVSRTFSNLPVAAAALAAIALITHAPLSYAQASYAQTAPAQTAPGASSRQAAQDPAQHHRPSGSTARGRRRGAPAETVEQRIADLHQRLRITADQEPLWKNVAQEMRDDAKAVEAAAKARQDKLATMTALDSLRSSQTVVQTHADRLNKMLDAFAPLYAAMNDDQKKNADAVFRSQSLNGPAFGGGAQLR